MNTSYKLGTNGKRYRIIQSAPVLAERESNTLGYHFEGEKIVCDGVRDEDSLHTVWETQHAHICLRQGEQMNFWSRPKGSDNADAESVISDYIENDNIVDNVSMYF